MLKVLYVTAELFPLVKTGGLADVSAALPPVLRWLGADVRLCLPGYPILLSSIPDLVEVMNLGSAFGCAKVRILSGITPETNVPIYLVDAPELFNRPGNPYFSPDGHLWQDNHLRFALFGWAAAHLHDQVENWRFNILHAHDWHAGMACAWLRAMGDTQSKSIFTIHNLAYQGNFTGDVFPDLNLPDEFFSIHGLEFYGKISFMKAGLFYADWISTVSPNYAREIQTSEHGYGLEGLLRQRHEHLIGILNGVDYEVWNPSDDPTLPHTYTQKNAESKQLNKAVLQAALDLEMSPSAPLFCVISRLTTMKGLDMVAVATDEIVKQGGQLVVIGQGDNDLEARFRELALMYPQSVATYIGYQENISHLVLASSDCLVMPSRSEPCGLTQLYAMKYGTIPLVCRVGGLADTVVDATSDKRLRGLATGFVFKENHLPSLMDAIDRAFMLYRDERSWTRLQRAAMSQNFSWQQSGRRYLELYNRAHS